MAAQHHKTSVYVKSHLFRGLKTFTELEARIAALPSNQEKGDAFEVFAEAYLATQRNHDAKEVWPSHAAPVTVLDELALPVKDYGIDGLYRTRLGRLNVYQVKFRTNRRSLSWDELSTFFGLADSPQIGQRVLITNSLALSPIVNARQNFFCIRGSDLDRLQGADFDLIADWCQGNPTTVAKKSPLPHQQEALDAIIPALAQHARVTTTMACGTGKTLLALWIAEQPQYRRVLVLVPSLALLRQTLHEWLKDTHWEQMVYQCVCSDPSVKDGTDALVAHQADLDFPVTTSPIHVGDFLAVPYAGIKVVFCTYQSAHVVAAALGDGDRFDLGIFDEAHKTAGRPGRHYAFALSDDNIPITKRLFCTATPRKYNPHKKDTEGEAVQVYSMDNEDIYGPHAFTLSFRQAAIRNIICPYKIIVSIITTDQINRELLDRGEVLVKGDAVRARAVANQIAMKDVVKRYGPKKAFTFHKTVRSAERFTGSGADSIENHLADFALFHVNGKMPTSQREFQMREFRDSSHAIISNARCLTEGVDVPAVDMVAFLSPRKSRVDIVQATGRAMRLSPGKTCGYILVPVYVEQVEGESIAEAVSRANYDEVWDVLEAMQEQDEVLYDVIQAGAIAKGRGGKRANGDGEVVEFIGPLLTVAEISKAIETRILEEFYESWSVWYGRLLAFSDRYGHVNVHADGVSVDEKLKVWVTQQRTVGNKGLLTDSRWQQLDKIGFNWNWTETKSKETWMEKYDALKVWAAQHGHTRIKRRDTEAPTLANWVWIQRGRGRLPIVDRWSGTTNTGLHREQRELLNDIGFSWNPHEDSWDKSFQEMTQAVEKGEDPNWPNTSKTSGWVANQREKKKKGILRGDRVTRLERLGVVWNLEGRSRSTTNSWKTRYQELVQFKETTGHVKVARKTHQQLAAWINHERQLYQRGLSDEESTRLLSDIGVVLERQVKRSGKSWDERFEQLKAYKERFGNLDVPQKWTEDPVFGNWVNGVRGNFSVGKLSEEKERRLKEIGFSFTGPRKRNPGKSFQENLALLKAYKAKHGHCRVKHADRKLYQWVVGQRSFYHRRLLAPERKRTLEAVGFEFGTRPETNLNKWQSKFALLKKYKAEHGHCRVSRTNDKELYTWLHNQRSYYYRGKLAPERKRELEAIGFEFGTRTERRPSATLTVEQILSGADDHFARTGKWPNVRSDGVVSLEANRTWRTVDDCLRRGHCGLQGGSSLSLLLEEHRNR